MEKWKSRHLRIKRYCSSRFKENVSSAWKFNEKIWFWYVELSCRSGDLLVALVPHESWLRSQSQVNKSHGLRNVALGPMIINLDEKFRSGKPQIFDFFSSTGFGARGDERNRGIICSTIMFHEELFLRRSCDSWRADMWKKWPNVLIEINDFIRWIIWFMWRDGELAANNNLHQLFFHDGRDANNSCNSYFLLNSS